MKRLIVALLSAIAVASPHAADTPRPDDFATRFALGNVAEGLNALELNEAVYRAGTQRSLNDLRLFNANGEALPFAVLPPAPAAAPAVRVLDVALATLPSQTAARDAALQAYALRYERDRHRAVFEIRGEANAPAATGTTVGGYLIDARTLKDRKGRLVLVFEPNAADFAGRVEVLGSEDLVNWRALVNGPLARERRLGEPIEKNRFELDSPPSFLRVRWASGAAPQIAAARYEELSSPVIALPRAKLAASLGNEGRSVYVDVPPALPIERLFIRLPQQNMSERVSVYRHVADPGPRSGRLGLLPRRAPEHWVPAGTLDVFRVVRNGSEVEGPPLAFSGPTDGVRIDFARPYAAQLPEVEAEWRPARIAFAARAPGPYRLAVGHAGASASPSLDLRALLPADDPSGTRLSVASIELPAASAAGGADTARAERIAAQSHWSRVLLWGVLATAVAGLAWMAWRLAVQLRTPSTPPRADAPR